MAGERLLRFGHGRPHREWLSILERLTTEELLALITAETDEGQRLRQSSPFAGVSTDEERLEIMDACERAAEPERE